MVLAERSSTWVVGFVVPAAIWLIIIAYWIGTSQPKLDGPANSATPSEAAILDAPRKAADATASPKPRSVEHTAAASSTLCVLLSFRIHRPHHSRAMGPLALCLVAFDRFLADLWVHSVRMHFSAHMDCVGRTICFFFFFLSLLFLFASATA